VSYVDAGYAVAIGGSFLYGISLVLRRRSWERALRAAQVTAGERDGAAVPGERS
jgi:hypothetical protein